MARRRSNILEDLYDIGTMLPWWAGLFLAAVTYLSLHYVAVLDAGTITNHRDVPSIAVRQVAVGVAAYAQYVLPAFLLLGALVSFWRRAGRSLVFNRITKSGATDKLDNLTWRQFEGLIHEFFHRKGYNVSQTKEGPDGGIDLILRKNTQTATVQCKHWRRKKVDVKVVREQLGVMTAADADECYVLSSGEFTTAAKDFAKGQPITLIDGDQLRKLLGIFAWVQVESRGIGIQPFASCPDCGAKMVQRTARRGPHAGSEFWGCSRFPKCRGIR
jgi:restriction system protein